MKVLLLDRAKNLDGLENSKYEYFGPWAERIKFPDDLSKQRNVYSNSNEVHQTLNSSINLSIEILEELIQIIPKLTDLMNYDEKFWKLLLGNYVTRLAGIIKDIERRHKKLPDDEYILGISKKTFVMKTPKTYSEFESLLGSSEFRIFLAQSYLVKRYRKSTAIDYQEAKDGIPYQDNYSIKTRDIMFFRKIKKYLKRLNPFINRSKAKAILWDNLNYFADIDSKYFVPIDFIAEISKEINHSEIDLELRKKIKDQFHGFIGEIISITLPSGFLENLANNINTIKIKNLKNYPEIQRIYTHGRIMVENDQRRVLASLLFSNGIEIYSIQHGGTMNYISHPSFFTECEIPTNLISWSNTVGEKKHNAGMTRKMPKVIPSLYLKSVKDNVKKSKKRWDVIIITLNEDRHLKWAYSPIFPDMAFDYFRRQKVLFEHFSNKENIMAKLYPYEYGWFQLDWLLKKYPSIIVDTKRKNLINIISKAELVVMDYHATAFLETLAINKPLLCTWNREWFKGSSLFEDDISRLKSVGVFHESPSSLITAYDEASENIDAWWQNKERVEVINEVKASLLSNLDMAKELWEEELKRDNKIIKSS